MIKLLENGKFYHIYNRGNNKDTMFFTDDDYACFMKLYKAFISGVADTLSWCLMKNHFHFLVRIKDENEIGYLNPAFTDSRIISKKWRVYSKPIAGVKVQLKPKPRMQFRHLLSTYTIYLNNTYGRTGSVIEKNYERSLVESNEYLRTLFLYVNSNPVKHSIRKQAEKYKWSSCKALIKGTSDGIVDHSFLKNYFDSPENFKYALDNYKPTDLE